MNALQKFLIIFAICAVIAIFVFVLKQSHRAKRGLVGCRVKYFDSNGGTSFGYISDRGPGNTLIVQNPWKQMETAPIPRQNVELIDREDWKEVVDTNRGNFIWDIENSESAKRMFDFYNMVPRTCTEERGPASGHVPLHRSRHRHPPRAARV